MQVKNMAIEYEKNKELDEKQKLTLEFEKAKAEIKKDVADHEHKLKMERLLVNLEMAKLGVRPDSEEDKENGS